MTDAAWLGLNAAVWALVLLFLRHWMGSVSGNIGKLWTAVNKTAQAVARIEGKLER